MVLERRDKLETVAGIPRARSDQRPASAMTEIEQDVLSALVNLGCNRPAAEAAIRKAKAGGIAQEIAPLFPKFVLGFRSRLSEPRQRGSISFAIPPILGLGMAGCGAGPGLPVFSRR